MKTVNLSVREFINWTFLCRKYKIPYNAHYSNGYVHISADKYELENLGY